MIIKTRTNDDFSGVIIDQYCHCSKPVAKKEIPQIEIMEILDVALEKRRKILKKRNINLHGILVEK